MSTISYATGCDDQLFGHVCDNCPDGVEARVYALACVDDALEFADPTDTAEWNTHIQSGQIIIIPDIRGEFDGGAPEYGDGFGKILEKLKRYRFKLTYEEEILVSNWAFYNSLKKSRTRRCWPVFGGYVWMTDKPAKWAPKIPVSTNPLDEVYWNVEVDWTGADIPEPVIEPSGIFTCFTVQD